MTQTPNKRSAPTTLHWLATEPGEAGLRAWIDDVLSAVLTHAETHPDEWSQAKHDGIDLIQGFIERGGVEPLMWSFTVWSRNDERPIYGCIAGAGDLNGLQDWLEDAERNVVSQIQRDALEASRG